MSRHHSLLAELRAYEPFDAPEAEDRQALIEWSGAATRCSPAITSFPAT